MKFDIDFINLKKQVLKLNDQQVKIGVFSDRKAKKANRKKPLLNFYNNRKKSRVGKNSKSTIKEVAGYNEDNYQLFSRATSVANQQDLIKVINLFADLEKTDNKIRQIENACQALVRNPLLRGDFGANTKEREKVKRFNLLGVDTGTLFNNIKAEYSTW